MSVRRKLKRATSFSSADWLLLGEATMALLWARLDFARLPARDLMGRLAAHHASDKSLVSGEADLRRLGWAIAAAANVLPWRTDCLIRCLAADRMLGRRGRIGRFHIGVAKSPKGDLVAHAWLTCGAVSIAGGDGAAFAPILTPETCTLGRLINSCGGRRTEKTL